MLIVIAAAIVGGATGAIFTGIIEAFLSSGAPSGIAVPVKAGILLPLGAIVAGGLAGLCLLLPPQMAPRRLYERFFLTRDAALCAGITVRGTLFLAALPLFYRVTYFFMTGFHHPGLAALFLVIALLALASILVLLGSRLEGWLAAQLARPSVPGIFRHGAAIFLFFTAIFALALIPPLVRGQDATGVFGFMGLFRKDGLGAGPLLSLSAMFSFGLIVSLLARSLRPTLLFVGAGAGLLLMFAGPFVASAALSKRPETLDALERQQGAGTPVGRVLRRLGDRDKDGHGQWLGGRDCDDRNPAKFPGNREVPDNGIDEDCSGADLKLAALREAMKKKSPAAEVSSQPLKKPEFPDDLSVFIISVDSLRWNAPGFNGNKERDLTPNLDRLVASGTNYRRAYAISSYTGQAIPTLLTGKYPSELLRNDAYETRVSGRELFAAETFCGEKVRCGAVLSHFLFSIYFGWNQGFHDWEGVSSTATDDTGNKDTTYNSHSVTNEAIRWLKNPENTRGRFLLWAHYMDPHKEYVRHDGVPEFGDSRRDRYDHEVLYTDGQIGRLIDYFKTLSAASRTIFIVTADHGEAFNEHGRWAHGKELWEEIIRVPLAIAGPGITTKQIDEAVSLIDIFPTLLDLFGAPIPEGTHGRSLVTDWVGDQKPPDRAIYAEQTLTPLCENRRAFIKDGYKLHHLPDEGIYRLYELTDDYERGDSLVESRPDVFARIRQDYEAFQALSLKPVNTVKYGGGSVRDMPLPE